MTFNRGGGSRKWNSRKRKADDINDFAMKLTEKDPDTESNPGKNKRNNQVVRG